MEDQDIIQGKISKISIWFRVMVFLVVMWAWYVSFMCQSQNGFHFIFSFLVPLASILLPDLDAPKSWKAKFLEPVSWRFVVGVFVCSGLLIFGSILSTPYFTKMHLATYLPWWQGFIGGLLLWATTSLVNRTRKFQNTQHNKEIQSQESLSEKQKDQSKIIFPSPAG